MALAFPIVWDDFSGTNGASLSGRTPDSFNMPGGTWTTYTRDGTFHLDTGGGSLDPPSVATTSNAAAYIPIASTVSYTKFRNLIISAAIQVGGITAGAGGVRGVGLGYFAPFGQSAVDSSKNFTGLVVHPTARSNCYSAASSSPLPCPLPSPAFPPPAFTI